MGILDTLARRLGYYTPDDVKALPRPGSLYPANGGNGIAYGGPLTFPGWDKFEASHQADRAARRALSNAWVYSDIAAIAREFSAAQIVVKTRDGEDLTDVDNHELEQRWRSPNPIMSRSFLAEYWVYSRMLFGESYLFLAPKGSAVGELWPIPAQRMTPVPDETLVIREYHYKVRPDQQRPIVIPAEHIVYSRTVNPFNPLRGLPPLTAAILAVDTDLAMAAWNRNFFDKFNAVPNAVISLKPDVQDTDFLRFRQELFDFFGGTQRRTMVARGGDVDVKMFGASQKDMDFLSGRDMSKQEIDRVFGIPEGYWSADATRANSSHASSALTNNVIWPLLVALAEDLQTALVPEWYPENTVIEFEDIRPRDRELALRETTSRLQYWTLNELRKEDGKDPLDGDIFEVLPAQAALTIASGGVIDLPDEDEEPKTEDDELPPDVAADPELAAALNGGDLPPADEAYEAATEQMTKALGQWERKALKRVKEGRGAACSFESADIPESVKAAVLESLGSAQTQDAVRAAFKAIRIIPRGVDEPVAALPDVVTVDDSDIGRAVDLWAEVMGDTEFGDILNAKTIGGDA